MLYEEVIMETYHPRYAFGQSLKDTLANAACLYLLEKWKKIFRQMQNL